MDLTTIAMRAEYRGSAKHVRGYSPFKVGPSGQHALTVEEARANPPQGEFTMLCPEKWNRRNPSCEATDLLRKAICSGQIRYPIEADGLPKFVWARDPDEDIIYWARRMSDGAYKAYPLTDPQIVALRIKLK